MSWRRELGIATACGTAFALPALAVQGVLAFGTGQGAELLALVQVGSTSRWHLVLQPLDAVASAAARVVVVALLCHLLLVVLVGRRDWRGSVAVVARASRVLALAPAFALLVVAWGVGLIGEVTEPLALAHKAMTGWLALQAGLWGWVLLRVPGRLRVEHEVSAAVAWFVGLAPAWALGLTAAIEAAL